jgi:hypothetical protein
MYEFTYMIVDGIPIIDRREDLSDTLNEQAECMARAVLNDCIVQVTLGEFHISLRED